MFSQSNLVQETSDEKVTFKCQLFWPTSLRIYFTISAQYRVAPDSSPRASSCHTSAHGCTQNTVESVNASSLEREAMVSKLAYRRNFGLVIMHRNEGDGYDIHRKATAPLARVANDVTKDY
jgi:hypothetical protein